MKKAVEWGVLTFTCHPFISGCGHRIMMLEQLIRNLKGNGAVFQRVDQTVEEFKRRIAATGKSADRRARMNPGRSRNG